VVVSAGGAGEPGGDREQGALQGGEGGLRRGRARPGVTTARPMLTVIAARVSQAAGGPDAPRSGALGVRAQKFAEVRCANGPCFSSAMLCSTMACARCSRSTSICGSVRPVSTAWCRQTGTGRACWSSGSPVASRTRRTRRTTGRAAHRLLGGGERGVAGLVDLSAARDDHPFVVLDGVPVGAVAAPNNWPVAPARSTTQLRSSVGQLRFHRRATPNGLPADAAAAMVPESLRPRQ